MRVTPLHWEAFIEICEKHPNLITGKFNGAQGKSEGHNLWKNVTTKLNGLGLGEKSETEWRRAVTDWKCKVKGKAAKLTHAATQTGGGPPAATPLTPLEERLIAIMGKKGFEGDGGIIELGFLGHSAPTCQANANRNEVDKQKETYQSVLEEIEVTCYSATESQPLTSFVNTLEDVLQDKRNENHEHDQAPTRKPSQEHDYCEDRVEDGNVKKRKRLRNKQIARVSKNLEDITSESLHILKNIDQNTGRIANAVERMADVLIKMIQQ